MILLALATSACHVPPPAAPARSPAHKRFTPNPRARHDGEISSISLDELFALQQSDGALIFDSRPEFFYRQGHIPGAIHLHAAHCDPAIERLKPVINRALEAGRMLVVYCSASTCRDARTLSRHLSREGIPVSIFSGGMRQWHEASLPVSTEPSALPSD